MFSVSFVKFELHQVGQLNHNIAKNRQNRSFSESRISSELEKQIKICLDFQTGEELYFPDRSDQISAIATPSLVKLMSKLADFSKINRCEILL